MASENETVAEIVSYMREQRQFYGAEFCALADRIEAAHRREIAVMDGERNGILKANESLAKDNDRLRECLKKALDGLCAMCINRGADKCVEGHYCESVTRWRKVRLRRARLVEGHERREMNEREYVVWMSVIFFPFAIIVFPFYIGWMICDSFLDVIGNKFKGGEER